MLGIFCVAERLLASQGLNYLHPVVYVSRDTSVAFNTVYILPHFTNTDPFSSETVE
jgi:hypothetical protein